jgi:hypothetical protein
MTILGQCYIVLLAYLSGWALEQDCPMTCHSWRSGYRSLEFWLGLGCIAIAHLSGEITEPAASNFGANSSIGA